MGQTKKRVTKKNNKRKKIPKNEKKLYFLLSLGIFSICAILFSVSFFLLPYFSSLHKNNIQAKNEKDLKSSNIKAQNAYTEMNGEANIREKQLESTNKNNDNGIQTFPKTTNKNSTKTKPIETKSKPKVLIAKTAEKQSQQTESQTKKLPAHKTEDPKTKKQLAKALPSTQEPKIIEQQKPTTKNKILFFVFDDAGHNLFQLDEFLKLPFKCTFAVLPGLPNSKLVAKRIRDAGHDVILHQPMQAINLKLDPGPMAITQEMSPEKAKETVLQNIREISPVVGFNNHEGSLITADKNIMRAILQLAKDENIFFLDSRTNAKTVAPEIANELQITILERDIFIDNSKRKIDMQNQIKAGMKIASTNGRAILIGHVFTVELAKLLTEMYNEISSEGFTFEKLSKY